MKKMSSKLDVQITHLMAMLGIILREQKKTSFGIVGSIADPGTDPNPMTMLSFTCVQREDKNVELLKKIHALMDEYGYKKDDMQINEHTH